MSDREPIQIGVDLRPLPLQVGEDVWLFNPDPGKEFFSEVTRAGQMMQALEQSKGEGYDEAFDAFAAAIAHGLVDKKQQTQFLAKGYGMMVLTAITSKLMEQIADLPTPPSQPSGKTQNRRGGN